MLSIKVKNIPITLTHMQKFTRITKDGGYYDTFDELLIIYVTVDGTQRIIKGITKALVIRTLVLLRNTTICVT